jgi:hypothetical protein
MTATADTNITAVLGPLAAAAGLTKIVLTDTGAAAKGPKTAVILVSAVAVIVSKFVTRVKSAST